MNWRRSGRLAVYALGLVLLPAAARAQTNSTITGVVKDASGGVLPGVQVEASSPAMIEKVRTVYTDGQGVYRIIDLRSGTYRVTFTLAGFATVVHDGLELPASFTMTVNAEMKVGELSESVTVTGAAPLVDTHSVIQQATIPRQVRDALPLPSNSGGFVAMIAGASLPATDRDVGGIRGEQTQQFAIHGGRSADAQQLRDGMDIGTYMAGGNRSASINGAATQEFVVVTQGLAAAEAGGVASNAIPRDGGNTFHFTVQGSYGSPDLQATNVDAALKARGVPAPASIKTLYDVAGGIGGPIFRDRLWFFEGLRSWTTTSYLPGVYFNKVQGTLLYERDLSRPGYEDNFYKELSTRLTWQAAPKHKIAVQYWRDDSCQCHVGMRSGTLAPEAAGDNYFAPTWRAQAKWTFPATNRLLFDWGSSIVIGTVTRRPTGSTENDITVTNSLTNFVYGDLGRNLTGGTSGRGLFRTRTYFDAGNMNYVTGSHSLTIGYQHRLATKSDRLTINKGTTYTFVGTTPQRVTYWAVPFVNEIRNHMAALFVQEVWSVGRASLNLGLRYSYSRGNTPEVSAPAGPFVPARDFPAGKIWRWTDLQPRLGAAYDLFGTGKTAVKASLGRYVSIMTNNTAAQYTPASRSNLSASRNWSDLNGDYVPQENELGPLDNVDLGKMLAPGVGTQFDPKVWNGFNVQPYSWQLAVALNHQLSQGLSIDVAYFRTWYGNFTVTDNLAVEPSDYDPFSVTSPVDARFPDGGGQRIAGLYDLNPSKFGLSKPYVTAASKFGNPTDVYNGVDVNVRGRFPNGAMLGAGLSIGREVTDNCFVVDSPQLRFCKVTPTWGSGTQLKVNGVLPLPYDFFLSGNWQNIPGINTTATFLVRNADVFPTLGRNLSGGANATRTISIIDPSTFFPEGRGNQIDMRLSRRFTIRGIRVEPQFNMYNLTNANDVLQIITAYGPSWNNVGNVLPARLIKFGFQIDF